MNEIIFFFHILCIIGFIYGAMRLGKEALFALCGILSILANLFVLKQVTLFSLSVTCSDAFAVGAVIVLNLVQENFGKKEAKRCIWISFLLVLFFGVMSQIHLLYTPNNLDWMQPTYVKLLSSSPRILIASLISYLIMQMVDIEVFQRLRKRFPIGALPLVMVVSVLCSQTIDTVLFSYLALYGILSSLKEIILLSLCIKLIAIVAMSLLSSTLAKRKVHEI